MMQIGRYVIRDMVDTIVKFKNGNVRGEKGNLLLPVAVGEDVVTVTVKDNGRTKPNKKYTVYVAPSAFEQTEEVETEAEGDQV